MRRVCGVVMVSGLAAACSVFGSSSEPSPSASPQDNALPPLDGSPIAGVFVSTSLGSDDAPGTAGRPVKTLKKAFALANEQKQRVIACAETYEENLTLVDGVSAYGYYECAVAPWKRGDRRAVVKAPASPAVLARGLTLPTRIEGFAIHAPDLEGTVAAAGNAASVALEVRDSKGLIVSESLLHGGAGAHGEEGKEGAVNVESGTSTGGAGEPQAGFASCTAVQAVFAVALCASLTTIGGGRGGKSTCASGASGGPGGDGGDGEWFNPGGRTTEPTRNVHGRPLVATAQTSVGGAEMLPGAPGVRGKDGTNGANGAWSLTAAGFAVGNGTAGTDGDPGRGGGGGGGAHDYRCAGGLSCSPAGSAYFYTASGAGGGAGGCAGIAGTAATGGGATIGALVIKSTIAFERTRIETARGGQGGKGTLGSVGLAGGLVQVGTTYSGSGLGGGAGGSSGVSGHGDAGPAIALAYAGTRPLTTAVELVPGPAAPGQPELRKVVATGTKYVIPVAGQAMPEYEIKL